MSSASAPIFRYNYNFITVFTILVAFKQTTSSATLFSFKGFSKDSILKSNLAFLGDAKSVDVNGSSVAQLTLPRKYSFGKLVFRKPFKIVEESPLKMVSFSTYFSFSMSNEIGNGLAFLMVSNLNAFDKFDGSSIGNSQMMNESEFKGLAIVFDNFKDDKEGDLNRIRVDGFSYVKVSNSSSEKLSCWIDYEVSSKRMEIRLSSFSAQRPVKPLLMNSIDFTRSLNDSKDMFIGITSSNGNSTQTCFIYSWSFTQQFSPKWMHSKPLDPNTETETVTNVPNSHSHCFIRVLAALIFGAACGVFGAYMFLLLQKIAVNRQPVTPEELVTDPSLFKVIVTGNKPIKDCQK